MSADDKLDVLKDMIVLIGGVVLRGEQHAQFQHLCVRYEELASKPKAPSRRSPRTPRQAEPIPDVYAAYNTQSRDDFLNWAATLEIPVLKQIVREEQFDPAGRAARWRRQDKFGELIYEQLAIRTGRGSGFGRAAGV